MDKDILSNKIIRIIVLLALLTSGYLILSIFIFTDLYLRQALIWNLFLAGLPLVLAIIIIKIISTHKIIAAFLFMAWVLLFPNSPYMLTDLIHTSMYTYYSGGFIADITSWTGFLHILTGVLLGVLYGYISLFMLQKAANRQWGAKAAWIFVCAASVLSGIAIYIGRFVRLNSWDVFFNPGTVLQALVSLLNIEAAKMSLLFAVMVVVTYTVFYFCINDEVKGPA